MPARCFTCDQVGHVSADCPNNDVLDTRPPWCGICDRRTRLVTIDLERGTVKKCPTCHPSPNKPVAQHKRCPQCKAITYKWDDNSDCGSHQPVGKQLEHVKAGKP